MTALRRSPWTALVVVAVIALAFLAQRQIMNRAFDRLEADQVAQDAERIRFALDAETRLLTGFGSTNSVWDSTYGDVQRGDAADFALNFPPADLKAVYGVDGILGAGPDGRFRIGGLAGAGAFAAPPAELTDAATLRRLFDPAAKPGAARCGLVTTSTVPFLTCGFASYDSAAENVAGGLVFLKALDPAALRSIGEDIDLPITAAAMVRENAQSWPSLTGRLGTLAVRTSTLGPDRIALSVEVPAGDGSVVLEAIRGRPIHATAGTVGRQLFGLGVVLGAIMLAGMVLLVRQGTRAKVRPLLGTTEAVIASGDRSLRIRSDDRTEIGALARAIDGMLDALQQQEDRLRTSQEDRERELAGSYEERRRLQEEADRAAQAAVGRTVEAVTGELARVAGELASVREAARTIDSRVAATDEATRGVAAEADRADRVTGALSASLGQVAGIAGLIQSVAEQTRLLALNATIEAARAGEAGRGFTVVASEVKGLAAETSRSTVRISDTVSSLGGDAEAVTALIQGMVDRITAIGEAAQGLSQVADEQRATLDRLEHSVAEATASVQQLGRA